MAADVRVRLSAEGVAEVVDALRRISAEAKKTGHDGAEGFRELGNELKTLGKEMIGFLAIGAIADQVKDLFAEVLRGANVLADLHEQTGLSTDTLQAMGAAAAEAGVKQETVNGAVAKFTQTVGAAQLGNKKAQQGFNELGISISDIKNKTADAQLDEVVKRIAEIDDESRRAAIGSKIFGDSFVEMAPAITKLADEGVGGFIEKLKQLGTYLDRDTIASMKRVNDQTRVMKEEVKGLATQFLVGLMPGVSETMDQFVKDTQGGVSGMQKLGQIVGAVVTTIGASLDSAGKFIGAFVADVVQAAQNAGAALDSLMRRDWNGLKANLKNIAAGDKAIGEQFAADDAANLERVKKAWGVVFGTEAPPKAPPLPEAGKTGRGTGGTGTNADMAAVARARAELIQAQLAAELKIYEAQAKLREEQDAQAYEEGKLSLDAYYKDREQIINDRSDKELAILKAKRDAIAAQPIPVNDAAGGLKKQADLATVNGDISAKEFERQAALAQLYQQQRNDQKKLAQDKLSIDAKIAQMEGDTARAARDALDAELLKMDEMLRKVGTANAEITRIIAEARDKGQAKIDFDEAKKQADIQLSQLSSTIQAIQDKVSSGALFPIQAEQQIIDVQRAAIPGLERIVELMKERAAESGNPQLIEDARQFEAQVRAIGIATNEAGLQMANLKIAAQDALQSGFSDLLMNLSNGAMSAGDAFRQLASSIISDIARVEAEFLSKQFVKWLTGGLGSGAEGEGEGKGGGFFSGLLSAIGGLFGGGKGEGASGVAGSVAQTANTTAVTANTAAVTATAAAQTGLLTALIANTTALAANTAAVGAAATSNAISAFAGGGQVNGPGTSTSDSIPALLSDGEFIVNAESVQRPGVLALLHAINGSPGVNRGRPSGVRRYAQGGMVAGGGSSNNPLAYVDASQLPHHIIQQAVDRAVLNVIAGNPVQVKQSIG